MLRGSLQESRGWGPHSVAGLGVTPGSYHISTWRPERSDEKKAQKAGLREGF